ncbi:hypothetical protein PPYR_13753 [Photinus pyralis]|uniref:HTH CENPB-type domain-containing protein n=1 Tax=Photinus pyralis TaxID=7054 RepID=A0A5N4A9Z1_PHOPY|nr:hypothetical protein PPYR_13753 [Photinus pyralis]
MTLKRLIRRGADRLPGFKKAQVFTDEEEKQLADYLLHASRLNYGLSLMKFRELAYEFGVANHKKIPATWDVKKIAGRDWARSFMDRNSCLSLRNPEPTSLARSTAFNKHTVSTFFAKLKTVIEKHGFTPENIWNLDETGVTTVHRPSKIIGPKGAKQVAKVTSGERGQLVTVCSAVNACGNHVPPFLILPIVNWQDRMLQGAPPGSAGSHCLLGQAYPKAFSPANIQSGFRVSGIFPFNSDIFREDEFYTSLVTDRPNPMGETTVDPVVPEFPPALSPSSQPGPSNQLHQSPTTNPSSVMISPVEVRPFPQAPPRVGIPTKGRKRGRCRILTETPEKVELEAELLAKSERKASRV